MATKLETDRFVSPDEWYANSPKFEGSWWPAWAKWLGEHSSDMTGLPSMGAPRVRPKPLADAPGTYVRQR